MNTLKNRITELKAKKPKLVFQVKPYITYHPKYKNTTEWVNCKCGTPIRGYIEDDRFEQVNKNENGKIIINKKLIFAALDSYTEIAIEMSNGKITTKHITGICKQCRANIIDLNDLEALYLADMKQMEADDGKNEYSKFREYLLEFKPVRIIEEGE